MLLSLNGMNRNQPLIEWANEHHDEIPLEEAARPAKDLIVEACNKNIWLQMGTFEDIDEDGDGVIDVRDVQNALSRVQGRHVSATDALKVLESIDADHSGDITVITLNRCWYSCS